jgi:cellulose biosynthesis protein BcsQ
MTRLDRPMTTVALVGNKGGAGKTTLCVNLASALHRHGSTVVLDSDPQRSTVQWRAMGADNGLAEDRLFFEALLTEEQAHARELAGWISQLESGRPNQPDRGAVF